MSKQTSFWTPAVAAGTLVTAVAIIVAGGYVVVHGLEAGWPIAVRALSGFVAFEALGVALAAAHRLTGIGRWVTDLGHSFERFALLSPIAVTACVVVPIAVLVPLGMAPLRAIFLGLAVTTAGITWGKPWWLWHQPEVESLRSIFGDRTVAGLYYAFAAFCAYIGFAGAPD